MYCTHFFYLNHKLFFEEVIYNVYLRFNNQIDIKMATDSRV